jgi:hypothetical protein
VKLVGSVTLQAESMQAVGDLTDLMGWNRQRQRSGRDLERNALVRRSRGVDEARLSVFLRPERAGTTVIMTFTGVIGTSR